MKRIVSIMIYFFLIIGAGLYIANFFVIKEKDIKKYHDILNRKDAMTSCSKLKRKPISQKRKNVEKDIFFNQNGQRMQYKVISKDSDVILTEKKGNFKIFEKMQDIDCLTQDKIWFDKDKKEFFQKVRYFKAKEGVYNYPSHKFETDSIKIHFFEIHGNKLPRNITQKEPYLSGFANQVSFLLTEKSPELSASHFRASFDFDLDLK